MACCASTEAAGANRLRSGLCEMGQLDATPIVQNPAPETQVSSKGSDTTAKVSRRLVLIQVLRSSLQGPRLRTITAPQLVRHIAGQMNLDSPRCKGPRGIGPAVTRPGGHREGPDSAEEGR